MTRGLLLALALGVAGCSGASPGAASGPDPDRYGYRLGSDDRRETMTIRPVADSTRYLLYPAVVDSVAVRVAGRPAAGDAVGVEVQVQGALPDACAELSEVTQSRQARYVTVDLTMRQPRERVCAAVVRPFRFYLTLDGAFPEGSYVLRLNGKTVPFQVLPFRAAE